jgi:hypothetical protein
MTISKRFRIHALVGAIGQLRSNSEGRLSNPGVGTLVSTAQTVVGRPLTPVRMAGGIMCDAARCVFMTAELAASR